MRVYADVGGFDATTGGYEAVLADAADRARTAEVLVAADPAAADDRWLLGAVTYVPGPGPYAEFADSDVAGLRMLAVAPGARRRGVGSALVRACIARAERDGRRALVLHTTPAMADAARLYPRLGFRRTPQRDFTTSDGTPLVAYAWHNPDQVSGSAHGGAPNDTNGAPARPAGSPAADADVSEVPADDPAVAALVEALMVELDLRYGADDPCGGDPFRPRDTAPGGAVLLARVDGDPAGTATVRPHDDGAAELKRMVVEPAHRGRGVGAALLRAAEDAARRRGFTRVILETGTRQPEAIGLYRQAGYTPIPPYGWYRDAPLSRCFAKNL